jgi:hypothetical protein
MLRLCAVAGCALVVVTSVRADHIVIDLTVQAGKASKSAATDTAALGVQPKKRQVLEARTGDKIVVKWTLTNKDPKAALKNVLVHFFAVKEDKVGQKTTPKLDKGVAAESALTMDFNPKDKSAGEMSFVIDEAGAYLLRVETIGAAVGAEGHEHFAALDLQVKGVNDP